MKHFALAVMLMLAAPQALAAGQGVVVVVNDQAITTFDIGQRQKLIRIFNGESTRKRALQSLIDDVVKTSEAKKLGIVTTEKMVDERIGRLSKNNPKSFFAQFKKEGISSNAVRRYISSQIAFQRLYRVKNPEKQITANPAEVDRKFKEIMSQYNKVVNDPRRRPVTIYSLLEVTFPVENTNDANGGQLMQARAVETQVYVKRFKGCKNARAAADGIFNVRIGKTIEAVADKLPKDLKAALDRVGPGRAYGPARAPGGLQVLGFCGKRTITPPKAPPPPTRDQVERSLEGKAFDDAEDAFMAGLRTNAIIDYKDKSLASE